MKTDELDQLVVHTETKDITLSQLREMVDANDIIVNPEYQRNYVYPDYVEYEIDKDRLSVRFLAPYSEERKRAAAEQAKRLLNPTIKAEGID